MDWACAVPARRLAYTLWIFLFTGIELLLWAASRRRGEFGAYLRGRGGRVLPAVPAPCCPILWRSGP